ncbi:MAG: histidine phosphatase family protein [Marinibacterium sp.]
MIRLALLRHGHTAWNRAGRLQGQSDIPLEEDARADLEDLFLPPPWDQADLWSSPLIRARDTARAVAGREPRMDAALSEMSWGDLEGRFRKDVVDDPASGYRHIEDWGWDFRPPGGESVREVAARLKPWLAGLQHDTVAVCHMCVMRVLLAQGHDWPFDGPCPFRIKRNRLFVLTVDGDRLTADPDPVRLIRRAAD